MKKFIYIFIVILLISICTPLVTAQTVTPTPGNNHPSLIDQISQLKEKIASRVAQLKLVEKRGVIGTVIDVSNTLITLKDIQGEILLIDVDEITKFDNPNAKGTFGISDITKGMQISVLGLYNKESKRILARFIEVEQPPVFITGTVTEVSKPNYTITLATKSGQKLIDIETTTKTYQYTNGALLRSGFAKIEVGQRTVVIADKNEKEANRFSANRIIIVPTPTITTVSPTPPTSVRR